MKLIAVAAVLSALVAPAFAQEQQRPLTLQEKLDLTKAAIGHQFDGVAGALMDANAKIAEQQQTIADREKVIADMKAKAAAADVPAAKTESPAVPGHAN
jgi:Tfp pilus assembly protein PilN